MSEPISALVWGQPKTRKSSFALSAPGPLHVFDFDQGMRELTEACAEDHHHDWWADDGTMICRVYVPEGEEPKHVTLHDMMFDSLDPTFAEYKKLLVRYESRYMKMLTGRIPCSTVVVDTDSQWVKVAQEVKVAEGLEYAQKTKGAKRTEPSRLDYGKYNQYRENTILKAKQAGINLILIERAQEIWGLDMEGKAGPTGQFKPRGSNDTGALTNFTIRMDKHLVNVAGKPPTTMYMGVIESCRFPHQAKLPVEGRAIKDLTFDKLMKALWGVAEDKAE